MVRAALVDLWSLVVIGLSMTFGSFIVIDDNAPLRGGV
jgi:hypothetical protein